MKRKMVFGLLLVCILGLTGCEGLESQGQATRNGKERGKTRVEKESEEDVDEDIDEDIDKEEAKKHKKKGSSKSMTSCYKGKYQITYYTNTSGHPSKGVDFSTYYRWKDETGSGSISIYYVVYDDDKIEDDYKDYDDYQEVTIDNKTFKYKTDGIDVILLYKVDDSFYISIKLFDGSQFGPDGMETQLSVTPLYMLENGWLDDEIKIEIVPEE